MEELPGTGEDDEGELSVAQNGKFMGLLHQTATTLGEGDLTTSDAIDFTDLYFSTGKGKGGILGLLVGRLVVGGRHGMQREN